MEPGGRLRLAAESLQGLAVARHVAGQDLQRHATAQRDLLGLVDHAHAAPADLAKDPVVADLAEVRSHGKRGRSQLAARLAIGLLDLDHRREHLADLLGHFREPVDVLLQARALAPAITLGELLGELVEAAVVARTGRRGHRQSPSQPPGKVASTSLSRFNARK